MLANNLWAVLVLAGFWAVGTLLARQALGLGWAKAWAPGWLLGSGLVSLGVFAVYLAGGALRPWLPLLLAALAAVTLWRSVRRKPEKPAIPAVEPATPAMIPTTSAAAGKPATLAGWPAWVVAAVLAIIAASTLVHALVEPEARFDALHNWGFKALSTATHGKPFQGYWPMEAFPNHVPFLAGAFMALQKFPQETAAHLIPFLFFLAALGLIGTAAQELSGRRGWGWPMALALAVGCPLLAAHVDQLYADLPLASLHLGAVGMAIFWLTRGRPAAAFLSGVFSGLGMWTKTEGLLLALGVGGALAFAALARPRADWRATLRGLAAWAVGVLLAGGPWPLYLLLHYISPATTGHVDNVVHWERLAYIVRETFLHFRRVEWLPALGAVFGFALGWSRKTLPLYLFLAAVIAAGFLHFWLPLLVIPGDAFGGWRDFMDNGLARYAMHIAPVMLLSVALVGRTGRWSGLDALLQRLMVKPISAR